MEQVAIHKHYDIGITFSPGAGDVWFSLRGTTYQNNSCVALEDIGEDDDALLCMTNFTACCKHPDTGENGSGLGMWFFPNGTRIQSKKATSEQLDFYSTRGQRVVHLNRRRGKVEGNYRCEIPDSMNVTQTIYIGVYTASSGESALLFVHSSSTVVILQCLCCTNFMHTVNDCKYSNKSSIP